MNIPYDKFIGKLPDLSRIRKFGCAAYAKIMKPNFSAFEQRNARGVHLGFTDDSSKYIVYCIGK